jgi:hypothetical protein
MAYPYQSAAGSKPQVAGPGRLWKRIGSERRLAAAEAFWKDEEESIEQQAEALLAIAQYYRFRPKSVRSLSMEQKVKKLSALPAVSDAVAARILVAYHLAHQRPMLGAFLDALGIAHDNGVLTVEEMTAPEPAKLAEAVAAIRQQFPADDVALYFETLLVQDPETWGGLAELLEPAGSQS